MTVPPSIQRLRDDAPARAERLAAAIERKRNAARDAYQQTEVDRKQAKRDAQSARQVRAYGRRRLASRGGLTRLATIRIALGMTQRDMAKAAGIGRHAYRAVERGDSTHPQSRRSRAAVALYLTAIGTPTTARQLRDDA